MADGSDREVTQADHNGINSQWNLFFTDLDELLCDYEQHQPTNDIALKESLTIRLENAVKALQNISPFVWERLTGKQFSKWPGISSWCFGTAIVGVNFQVEQEAHKWLFCQWIRQIEYILVKLEGQSLTY